MNFSLYSRHATGVELLLFDSEDCARPSRTICLDPDVNRTYYYWHLFVPGLKAGQLYGYRVRGPFEPCKGMRFDPEKVLLDPYARSVIVPRHYSRAAAAEAGDNTAGAMKGVVVDTSTYDWEGDVPLRRPWCQTIIYELHVRGFTRHPSSNVGAGIGGTYAGLCEKIPYLKELGITAVELMPVFQFDAQDCPPGLVNYWGYAPVSFFAPHRAYSSRASCMGALDEFRDMVKVLHRAGIEVILDVVFNHTAEGDQKGPTFSLRGIDNCAYYILEGDKTRYADYTGTGNTINGNHPIVRRMILDSLRYWVSEMHVDGFRFDLASIMARDSCGQVLANPPLLWDIETDPFLAGVKLIAEAWDAAGLYQVGSFPGDSWKEWNGRFRDEVRSFFRGDNGSVQGFADGLMGSPKIYEQGEREAEQSINFVTCHDGFTLNDLVSYNTKHNEANKENNRDGADDNRSYNFGVEGPSTNPEVEKFRERQVKNLITVTTLALGVPMFSMGDEVRRTQGGNNNAYCHDDETTWFDWGLLNEHADLLRFFSRLCAYRVRRDDQPERARWTLKQLLGSTYKEWHGVALGQPDWSYYSHSLALSGEIPPEKIAMCAILNAYWDPLRFELPFQKGGWRRWIDTGQDSPCDIVDTEQAPLVMDSHFCAQPHSVVVLVAPLVEGSAKGSR